MQCRYNDGDCSIISALSRSLLDLRVQRASAETTQYSYDALGRLTAVTYSSGGGETYAYDAAGNRTTLSQSGPPSGTFTAAQGTINQGASTTLSWTSARSNERVHRQRHRSCHSCSRRFSTGVAYSVDDLYIDA